MQGICQVSIGVIYNADGLVLIAERPPHSYMGGFWEFPGGKLEHGETAEQALIRELQEEISIIAVAPKLLLQMQYEYPQRTVNLHVFIVQKYFGEVEAKEGQKLVWIIPQASAKFNFLPATVKILQKLFVG